MKACALHTKPQLTQEAECRLSNLEKYETSQNRHERAKKAESSES
jgi:hypothetical protein